MSEFPEVLTAREAAEALRISHSHMLKMLREGAIPSAKVGKTYRIPRSVIDEMLTVQPAGSASAYTRSSVSGE